MMQRFGPFEESPNGFQRKLAASRRLTAVTLITLGGAPWVVLHLVFVLSGIVLARSLVVLPIYAAIAWWGWRRVTGITADEHAQLTVLYLPSFSRRVETKKE